MPNSTLRELAKMIDHSLLHPTMTDSAIREGCRLARACDVATACVKPYSIPMCREILAGSGLWRVIAASCLVVTGIDLFHFYMPIYGHSVGLSASAIGVVLATFSAAAFVVRVVLPLLVRRVNEVRVLVYALLVGAASYMLVPFFRSQTALALISFVFGLGMGCGQPITTMLTFSNSAEGRSGEVLGLRIAINHLTRVTGPILFGLIGSAFGVFPVFWVNALFLASGGAIAKPGAIGGKGPVAGKPASDIRGGAR